MEANIEEALRAKEIAEKRFAEKDFAGAKNYALKAKTLCPGLEGISQMVATFDVYIASEVTCNGEIDYYSVLGLKPSADRDAVKKQYRKMAVLLHPDKNKTVGADGAFKLVSEAWTMLSDNLKGALMIQEKQTDGNLFQYEYLRKYVNKRLSCKNCRVGMEVMDMRVPYVPTTATVFAGNGISGLHSGHGYEYVSNVSFQWSSFSGTSAAVVGHNGSSAVSTDAVYQVNGNATGARANFKSAANGKHSMKTAINNMNSNVSSSYNESSGAKAGRPDKKRKVVVGPSFKNEYEGKGLNSAPEVGLANGNASVETASSFPIQMNSQLDASQLHLL
ncbi:hypothetical protein GH714_030695 [Hevea brasiliensis]|uniref:J domain-containing protein n=1 Tax=Hevea brasiliensis TaxID=3981 RepID=A0A6A6K8U2_HEVBR|nr:hypothetical protein GH714_030695 [Hevea brasiliensis]